MASASNITLKLLVDKKANKVLFAEASKEAVDFLCSILTLPVATVIMLLSEEGMVGCLPNLYQSITDLNYDYVLPNKHKDTVLNPTVYSFSDKVPLLLLNVTHKEQQSKQFYGCRMSSKHRYVTNVKGVNCPSCQNELTKSVTFLERNDMAVDTVIAAGGGHGGFVKGLVTYMVMDDLVVTPMSTITGIALLNKFNVTDLGALEEKNVVLDMAKGLKLLKTAFQSKQVLSKVFL